MLTFLDMKKVSIYSTSCCADCKRAKKWMDDNKISYTDIDIEKVPGAKEEMLQINGDIQHTPTVVFPDGSFLVEPTNVQLDERLSSSR